MNNTFHLHNLSTSPLIRIAKNAQALSNRMKGVAINPVENQLRQVANNARQFTLTFGRYTAKAFKS